MEHSLKIRHTKSTFTTTAESLREPVKTAAGSISKFLELGKAHIQTGAAIDAHIALHSPRVVGRIIIREKTVVRIAHDLLQ